MLPLMAGAPTSASTSPDGSDVVAALEPLTTTCDTSAVVVDDELWLVVAMPTYAVVPSAIVSVPSFVQLVPFDDTYAVTVVPERTSRTQYGVFAFGPAVFVDPPPFAVRR